MEDHYSTGRRYSHIHRAWIFADDWDDREEIARLNHLLDDMKKDRDAWKRAAIERELICQKGEKLAQAILETNSAHPK